MPRMVAGDAARWTAAMVLASTLACAAKQDAELGEEAGSSDAMAIPDLGAPETCEPAPLPVFDADPCVSDEDHVAIESPGTIEPKPDIPDAEAIEFHWLWSCLVVSVALSPACDEIELVMSCDDAGVVREVRSSFLSIMNPEPALTPGMLVDYDVDHFSAFEGYGWTSARIIGTEGILVTELHFGGWLENAYADPLVEDALADFSGRRTSPICMTSDPEHIGHRYAIELIVDGETVTVPHDTALDVGDYRILVADAWSSEQPDFGPSTYHGIDVLIFRTAP